MKEPGRSARKVVHPADLTGDLQAQAALANIIRVGTSAGGARAKAVVAWNPQTDRDTQRAVRRRPRLRALAAQVRRRRQGYGTGR
jgi:hypothetical protein